MDEAYWCPVCNYFYLPWRGDPSQGVAPGTPFEELPDSWRCPLCFEEKDNFLRGQ